MRLIFLIGLVLSLATAASATEYLVKKKPGFDLFSLKSSKASAESMSLLSFHELGRLIQVDIEDGKEFEVLMELYKDPSVEYIVENIKMKLFSPTVTEMKEGLAQSTQRQWALEKVNAKKAWELVGQGSSKVVVSVIDTGVELTHEALVDNIVDGYDFLDNDSDPTDTDINDRNPGHGTHCAGIIGATGKVSGSVFGLSPVVSIMPIRFISTSGGTLLGAIKSIDYSIEHKANIISASWGAKANASQSAPLIEAVERADKAGIVFVSAAGNDGKSNDKVGFFPVNAKFDNVIGVAASTSNDTKPNWSNYGKGLIDVAAPGHQIINTLPGNEYGNLSGTSMAAPLVSGLVALALSYDPSLTGQEVRSLLQVTGAKVDIEVACNCRIDAGAAMEALVNKKMFVVPAASFLEVGDTQKFHAVYASASSSFESSNTDVATIGLDGTLKALKIGITQVTITTDSGQVAKSLDIVVGTKQDSGGGGGGGGGVCLPGLPPMACELLCSVFPIPILCPGSGQ